MAGDAATPCVNGAEWLALFGAWSWLCFNAPDALWFDINFHLSASMMYRCLSHTSRSYKLHTCSSETERHGEESHGRLRRCRPA